MESIERAWVICVSLVSLVLITLTIAMNVGRTMTLMRAFENGYCEVTLPGRERAAWQKCDTE